MRSRGRYLLLCLQLFHIVGTNFTLIPSSFSLIVSGSSQMTWADVISQELCVFLSILWTCWLCCARSVKVLAMLREFCGCFSCRYCAGYMDFLTVWYLLEVFLLCCTGSVDTLSVLLWLCGHVDWAALVLRTRWLCCEHEDYALLWTGRLYLFYGRDYAAPTLFSRVVLVLWTVAAASQSCGDRRLLSARLLTSRAGHKRTQQPRRTQTRWAETTQTAHSLLSAHPQVAQKDKCLRALVLKLKILLWILS